MAGNAWKYSHKLDDVDLEFLQHDFITIKQGVNYYGLVSVRFLGWLRKREPITRLARW